MKKALKKWITELLMALGGLAIFITFLSVIPDLFESNYPTQEHRQQYFNFLFRVMQLVILTIPLASLVEAIIMEYQLFSKNVTATAPGPAWVPMAQPTVAMGSLSVLPCQISALSAIYFFSIVSLRPE